MKPNMVKFNRNTWVKVPEFDSAPLPPCPKRRIHGVSFIKPKRGRRADRNGQERYFFRPKRVTTIGIWDMRMLNTV